MTAKPLGHEKGRVHVAPACGCGARHRGHTDLPHLDAAGCDIREFARNPTEFAWEDR
jgi:hypothetical protein